MRVNRGIRGEGIAILAPGDDPISQKYFREHMAVIDAEVRKRCEEYKADPANFAAFERKMERVIAEFGW